MPLNGQESIVPDKCPVCNTKKKNILLHIQLREECRQKIDDKTFESWREQAKKKSKRKYQVKNVDSGNHMRLQEKYNKTMKAKEVQRKLYIRNRLKQKRRLEKLHSFNGLSVLVYVYLRALRTPMAFHIEQFQLMEEEPLRIKKLCLKDEEKFEWLKDIETALFEAVISLQILVLIPKSQWLIAIEKVEQYPANEMKETLFKLIGKLQDHENENTKGIEIPGKYRDEFRGTWDYHDAFKIEKLTKENELYLIDSVAEIVGDEEGLHCRELQELLNITLEMDRFYQTLGFTSDKYELNFDFN